MSIDKLIAEARRQNQARQPLLGNQDPPAFHVVAVWYRIRDYDASENWDAPDYRLQLMTYEVQETTPHTVVLLRFSEREDGSRSYYHYDKRIRCSKTARVRRAHPTIELALNSYWHRKNHHIARLEHQLAQSRAGMAAAALIRGIRGASNV